MLFSRIQRPLASMPAPSVRARALSMTFPRGNTGPASTQPSTPTPTPNPEQGHGQGEGSSSFKDAAARYKIFVGPFAKVFLGAIFTYQVIYWTWLKLEMDEAKVEKNKEVSTLEKMARALTKSSK